MSEERPQGEGGEPQQCSLLELAFGAVLVAGLLAFMMLWAVGTLGCRSC